MFTVVFFCTQNTAYDMLIRDWSSDVCPSDLRIGFEHRPDVADVGLRRAIRRFPFVPNAPARLDADCYEAFNIQVEGLLQRVAATGTKRLVIGVSGGLDSSHALLAAAKVMDRLGRPRVHILGYPMPRFATGAARLDPLGRLSPVPVIAGE